MKIDLPQFPDGNLLTHSATKCWLGCQQCYAFRYVYGVRPRFQSEPLRIGSMWHLGVDTYECGGGRGTGPDQHGHGSVGPLPHDSFQSEQPRTAIPPHQACAGDVNHGSGEPTVDLSPAQPIDLAEKAIRDEYLANPCPPYLTPDEYSVEEEKVVAMVRGHYEHYKDDQILKTLAVEQAFALPVVNPATGKRSRKFKNAGMIDRIAELPDGTVAVVERKTTSEDIELDAPYWKALRNDAQISRYLLAARELGYDATKVVYDVIRKPSIRPKNVTRAEMAIANRDGYYYGMKLDGPCSDHETPKMYGARLLADIKTRPDFYLQRVEIPRLDDDLREFQVDMWNTQKAIAQAMRDGVYIRNPSACLEPYRCIYLDVCTDMRRDPSLVPDGFVRVEMVHPELKFKETQ